ncbi:MAG TPA: potassium transporter TrkA [Streptosporangiaceae bacterium]
MRRRVAYWFDKTMARGTFALVGWLAAICLVADIPISVVLVRYKYPGHATLAVHAVEVWKMVGSTFKVGGQVGPPLFVLASVAGAVVELLFASTLISLITAGVNKKIMDLRRGKSQVLEDGHVAVVGWSAEVFPIAAELKASSARHGHKLLAVLADRDKAGMEDEIRARVHDARVMCRSGNPVVPADIARINPEPAQCLIVLASPGDDTDEQVIKSLLAIRNKTQCRVVAAISNHGNLAAARKAGGPGAQLLDIDDLASRWIAQAAVQPGLSGVFTELLRFDGNEFCAVAVPGLAGQEFGRVLNAFPLVSPVGLARADGSLLLNPPSGTVLTADDKIIAISAEDTFAMGGPVSIDEAAIAAPQRRPRMPVRLLILGWNRRAPQIIRQLDAYVPTGSRIDVTAERISAMMIEKVRTDLNRTEVAVRNGDPADVDVLSSLDLASYRHIIVLSADGVGDAAADFRSLVTLLHLREFGREAGQASGVTGEIADDHTLALAPVGEADDFIVSRTMVSHLMTQVAMNPELVPVFTELFDPEGNEIIIRPAGDFVRTGCPITFATVAESARRQGGVAIGYRRAGAVTLNPDRRVLVTLGDTDAVIVIAGG